MDEVSRRRDARSRVLAALHEDNPVAGHPTIVRYADAVLMYVEARDNLDINGAVVAHPRTGAPSANPYLAVLERTGKIMADLSTIDGDKAINEATR